MYNSSPAQTYFAGWTYTPLTPGAKKKKKKAHAHLGDVSHGRHRHARLERRRRRLLYGRRANAVEGRRRLGGVGSDGGRVREREERVQGLLHLEGAADLGRRDRGADLGVRRLVETLLVVAVTLGATVAVTMAVM